MKFQRHAMQTAFFTGSIISRKDKGFSMGLNQVSSLTKYKSTYLSFLTSVSSSVMQVTILTL